MDSDIILLVFQEERIGTSCHPSAYSSSALIVQLVFGLGERHLPLNWLYDQGQSARVAREKTGRQNLGRGFFTWFGSNRERLRLKLSIADIADVPIILF